MRLSLLSGNCSLHNPSSHTSSGCPWFLGRIHLRPLHSEMATDGSSQAQPLDINDDVRQEVKEGVNIAIQGANNTIEAVSTPVQVSPADAPSQQPEDENHDDHLSLYEHVRMLGHGGSASVEMVRNVHTGSVFARKTIQPVYARNMEDARRKLLNEVNIMQRLASHRHIARVHATFIKGKELAIILEPVADGGDLANFLHNYRDEVSSPVRKVSSTELTRRRQILERAFGCLASALASIHKQTIRHKDIKPQNILIHRGEVMYTDFGLSYDFAGTGRSTSTGNPQGFTRKYCAPEVFKGESRNSKSDIFSLGCVFIEIILARANDSGYDQLYDGPFHALVRSPTHGLFLPTLMIKENEGEVFDELIESMMSIDPASRPSASAVAYMISECLPSSFFCSQCREEYHSM